MINQETLKQVKSYLKGPEKVLWAQSVPEAVRNKKPGFIARLFKMDASFKYPVYYVITDRRLLAFSLGGKLEDEMKVEDMELFVDLGSQTEFMVSRKNDPDSENGFHFYLPENQAAAQEILFTKFGLK